MVNKVSPNEQELKKFIATGGAIEDAKRIMEANGFTCVMKGRSDFAEMEEDKFWRLTTISTTYIATRSEAVCSVLVAGKSRSFTRTGLFRISWFQLDSLVSKPAPRSIVEMTRKGLGHEALTNAIFGLLGVIFVLLLVTIFGTQP